MPRGPMDSATRGAAVDAPWSAVSIGASVVAALVRLFLRVKHTGRIGAREACGFWWANIHVHYRLPPFVQPQQKRGRSLVYGIALLAPHRALHMGVLPERQALIDAIVACDTRFGWQRTRVTRQLVMMACLTTKMRRSHRRGLLRWQTSSRLIGSDATTPDRYTRPVLRSNPRRRHRGTTLDTVPPTNRTTAHHAAPQTS